MKLLMLLFLKPIKYININITCELAKINTKILYSTGKKYYFLIDNSTIYNYNNQQQQQEIDMDVGI